MFEAGRYVFEAGCYVFEAGRYVFEAGHYVFEAGRYVFEAGQLHPHGKPRLSCNVSPGKLRYCCNDFAPEYVAYTTYCQYQNPYIMEPGNPCRGQDTPH